MRKGDQFGRIMVILILASLVIFGCRFSTQPSIEPPATPTPTDLPDVLLQPADEASPCVGLTGHLEMQILVGPSEVVGMEPVSIGEIPFSVVDRNGFHMIEGGGSLNFDEQVFEAEWGTYTVNFSADSTISGKCESLEEGEVLHMTVTMEGEQMVSVRAEGLQGDYPWSGTQEISASFPAEEGATESEEGWLLVLHLNP